MRGRTRLSAVLGLIVTAVPAGAATSALTAGNIMPPRVLTAPAPRELAVGAEVKAPRSIRLMAAPAGEQPAREGLSCRMVCSPFTPRHVIAQLSFPEAVARGTATPGEPGEARLDIAGTPAGFRQGSFGTVRLDEIAIAEMQPGAGLDVERLRERVNPAFLTRVQNHRVVARDPALVPQRLLQVFRAPGVPASLPEDLQQALQRDARGGALEQLRLLVQGVETARNPPRRTVIVEGLQPGLTYGMRVVRERNAEAETTAENICRVPVCPADFQQPR